MSLQITALYAAIFVLMAVVLSMMVSSARRRSDISILHRDDAVLAVRIRRHGNFIENVPLLIILMGLLEAQGASPTWLHAMGVAVVGLRVAHVFGLHAEKVISVPRFVAALGTHLVMVGAAGYLLWSYFL